VALCITDFLTDFWTTHGMFTAVVAGILVVVIALTLLDTWTRDRNLDVWRRVANISFKALARSVVVSRDGLVMFVEGDLPYQEDPTPQAADCARFRSVVDRNGALDQVPDRLERLDILLRDSAWVALAYSGVRVLAAQARDALAHWAPVMVENPRLAATLNDVAAIADALEDLHRPLGPLHRTANGIASAQRRTSTAALWDETITACVALEEALAHRMGRIGWASRARELLSNGAIARLDSAEAGASWETIRARLTPLRDDVRGQHASARETALLAREQAVSNEPPTDGQRRGGKSDVSLD
jgi:hypothetical protein